MSRSRLLILSAATLFALGYIFVAATGVSAGAVRSTSMVTAPQQSPEDDVVTAGDDVQPPKKTKHVTPVYPEDAKKAGIEGVVILEVVISREGKVASTKVVQSVPELDQAAIDAVLQWEFEPTSVKGKRVSVRMTVTVNFTLA